MRFMVMARYLGAGGNARDRWGLRGWGKGRGWDGGGVGGERGGGGNGNGWGGGGGVEKRPGVASSAGGVETCGGPEVELETERCANVEDLFAFGEGGDKV